MSTELRISGTGFIGAKNIDFYFDPPLFKEIDYEVSTVAKDEIVLRLRHGYKWREDPGPLYVVSVDTGGGPVKVNGDDGVKVAFVQADFSAESTAADQMVYWDESSLIISGTGFNPQSNALLWANGVEYTTGLTTETTIQLKIETGRHWLQNPENLPGYLTLLAVNTGWGFVPVGPFNTWKGRDIATVFERPKVLSSYTKISNFAACCM
jgi:hypothetical protein